MNKLDNVLLGKLESHPIFDSLVSLDQLRGFMELHVYAVWDFMSLLKSLQSIIAPHGSPWLPNQNSQVVRLINEIVLEEESDIARPDADSEYVSHFDMYLNAMEEIGAQTKNIKNFVSKVAEVGISEALDSKLVPYPVRTFFEVDFDTIGHGKVHEIAASFAYGRENLVPVMFNRILETCHIDSTKAPLFHYYLERHAHLDGEQHGPMADQLVQYLTENDSQKIDEVRQANRSVKARIELWDRVLEAIPNP